VTACSQVRHREQGLAPDWPLLVAAAARLGGQLAGRGQRIATAESCTGGLIAALLTESPGSSAWFDRGFVTYSNAAKIESLGVPADLLARFGAVSEPVVRSMATGALTRSEAGLAIAVSGIAGPGGGSTEKPVGTVCVAWAIRAAHRAGPAAATLKVVAVSARFPGDRHSVRMFTARLALFSALELLRL
jgi:nicotinamide-nucleotide amidase